MKKFANYYHDGKIKYDRINGHYYYKDKDNYLFSEGIYKTKIKEEDLPNYYIKVWLYPRYKYISLKNIRDIYYRPSFFTNHWRKDDSLYISYNNKIVLNEHGYGEVYDEVIWNGEIDNFIEKLEIFGYDQNKINKIKKTMEKKDKWYKYWDKHDWNGDYSFTSEEVWKEILGDEE